MELLAELTDKSLGISDFNYDTTRYKKRNASRAILFDENKNIAILYVAKEKYHKLPGGGWEGSEDSKSSLIREGKEETGCEIEIGSEIGCIEEIRNEFQLKQTSYCFLAKVLEKNEPSFTEGEIENGFVLKWLPLNEAIIQISKEKPGSYEGKFIVSRDSIFMKEAKNKSADFANK